MGHMGYFTINRMKKIIIVQRVEKMTHVRAQSRNLVKSGFSTSLSYPIPENIVDVDWLSFQLGVK